MNGLILERVEKYHLLVSISRFYKRRFTVGYKLAFVSNIFPTCYNFKFSWNLVGGKRGSSKEKLLVEEKEWASREFLKNKLIREAGLSSTLASSENLIHCRWRDPLILSSNRIHNLPTLSPLRRSFRHSSLCISVLYPLSPRGESWKILEAFESLNPVISPSAFLFFLPTRVIRYEFAINNNKIVILLIPDRILSE